MSLCDKLHRLIPPFWFFNLFAISYNLIGTNAKFLFFPEHLSMYIKFCLLLDCYINPCFL